MPEGFDWESVYGLYTSGVEKSRQRLYDAGKDFFNRCLSKDPSYIPAYTGLAEIDFKEMKYDEAEKKLLHVISFDTYDPDANFLYGTILMLKKEYNKARDAFGVTLRSPGYKSASLNQLALIALNEKRLEEAWEYAMNAELYNGLDINIYKTAAVIARLRGDMSNYQMILQRLVSIDPLCHFAAFEKYFSVRDTISRHAFTSKITSELKYETYIELALWYFNAGLENEAAAVMEMCPENPLADYLSAYLAQQRKDEKKSEFFLERANKAGDQLVFPFRDEYAPILKWADQKQPNWKVKYYSALLYWSKAQNDVAEKYFTDCGDMPDSFSFYLTRGSFKKQTGGNEESDYLTALKYGANNWRTYHILNGYYLSHNNNTRALDISQQAMTKFNNLYLIRFDHAQSLLNNGKYEECVKILETTEILPNEGASNGRRIWESANLQCAISYYSLNKASKALVFADKAYEWPEKLGVGKPYDVDETVENFVRAMILDKLGKRKEAEALYSKITESNKDQSGSGSSVNYLTVMALNRLGRKTEATGYFNRWMELSKDKTITEWAKLLNVNQKEKAAALVQSEAMTSQNIRGNAGRGDADLRIINEIAQKYGIY
jgi:predicted Zn-dependent protease